MDADACHALKIDPDAREDSRRRLLSIKGHVEGILRMLDNESTYCVDVLKQVNAVEGGLAKVSDLVLRSHLKIHVATAATRGDVDDMVEELMEVLKYRW